jgi:NADPH2:quinone reductase
MKSIVIHRNGGPEVMELVHSEDPVAGPGQVVVSVSAAGVNFMDIGVRRSGEFWAEFAFPKTLGVEGAGEVVAVGAGVSAVRVGQRVAWVYAPGSYADKVVIPEGALVPLPDDISDQVAAALMMQGLTASHFATEFYPVQRGDFALVHAAAGGLGSLLTQIIKLRGGTVIGRVSSPDKIDFARESGAEHVIVDSGDNFAQEAVRLSDGLGVHVVYDGSGPRTFQGSLDALRVSGTFAWYGPVLGAPESIQLMSLPKSIKIGYAVFAHHVPTPELLRARAQQLFDWHRQGDLQVRIGRTYPLDQASAAHTMMEARASTGKLLLIP